MIDLAIRSKFSTLVSYFLIVGSLIGDSVARLHLLPESVIYVAVYTLTKDPESGMNDSFC